MSGFVVIRRTIIGHPAFRNDLEAMAFVWMVMNASWKPTRVRYKGHGIHLKRGQLSVSVRDMARALDQDKSWIERLWKRLKSEAMIETAVNGGVTIITICNYSKYQDVKAKPEEASETVDETPARQGRDTEQPLNHRTKEAVSKDTAYGGAWKKPDGVAQQVWDDLLSNRKRKHCGNTPTAWKRFTDDLTRISAKTGISPPELIENAAASGWAGIYEPRKDEANERPARETRGPTREVYERLKLRLGAV